MLTTVHGSQPALQLAVKRVLQISEDEVEIQARAAIISDRAAIAECVRHTKDIEEKLNLRFGYTPLSWELPT